MSTQAAINVVAIGQSASELHCAIRDIRTAAAQLDIRPAMRINGVDHFAVADLERIDQYIGRQRAASLRPGETRTTR